MSDPSTLASFRIVLSLLFGNLTTRSSNVQSLTSTTSCDNSRVLYSV
jgi:hypothetical protein